METEEYNAAVMASYLWRHIPNGILLTLAEIISDQSTAHELAQQIRYVVGKDQ